MRARRRTGGGRIGIAPRWALKRPMPAASTLPHFSSRQNMDDGGGHAVVPRRKLTGAKCPATSQPRRGAWAGLLNGGPRFFHYCWTPGLRRGAMRPARITLSNRYGWRRRPPRIGSGLHVFRSRPPRSFARRAGNVGESLDRFDQIKIAVLVPGDRLADPGHDPARIIFVERCEAGPAASSRIRGRKKRPPGVLRTRARLAANGGGDVR